MKRMFPDAENLIEAEVVSVPDADGMCEVSFDGETFPLQGDPFMAVGQKVPVALDPAACELCDPEDATFSGILDSVVWKGSHYEMILVSDRRRWLIKSQMDEQAGSEVSFRFDPAKLHLVKGEEK